MRVLDGAGLHGGDAVSINRIAEYERAVNSARVERERAVDSAWDEYERVVDANRRRER